MHKEDCPSANYLYLLRLRGRSRRTYNNTYTKTPPIPFNIRCNLLALLRGFPPLVSEQRHVQYRLPRPQIRIQAGPPSLKCVPPGWVRIHLCPQRLHLTIWVSFKSVPSKVGARGSSDCSRWSISGLDGSPQLGQRFLALKSLTTKTAAAITKPQRIKKPMVSLSIVIVSLDTSAWSSSPEPCSTEAPRYDAILPNGVKK